MFVGVTVFLVLVSVILIFCDVKLTLGIELGVGELMSFCRVEVFVVVVVVLVIVEGVGVFLLFVILFLFDVNLTVLFDVSLAVDKDESGGKLVV